MVALVTVILKDDCNVYINNDDAASVIINPSAVIHDTEPSHSKTVGSQCVHSFWAGTLPSDRQLTI